MNLYHSQFITLLRKFVLNFLFPNNNFLQVVVHDLNLEFAACWHNPITMNINATSNKCSN